MNCECGIRHFDKVCESLSYIEYGLRRYAGSPIAILTKASRGMCQAFPCLFIPHPPSFAELTGGLFHRSLS